MNEAREPGALTRADNIKCLGIMKTTPNRAALAHFRNESSRRAFCLGGTASLRDQKKARVSGQFLLEIKALPHGLFNSVTMCLQP